LEEWRKGGEKDEGRRKGKKRGKVILRE